MKNLESVLVHLICSESICKAIREVRHHSLYVDTGKKSPMTYLHSPEVVQTQLQVHLSGMQRQSTRKQQNGQDWFIATHIKGATP